MRWSFTRFRLDVYPMPHSFIIGHGHVDIRSVADHDCGQEANRYL